MNRAPEGLNVTGGVEVKAPAGRVRGTYASGVAVFKGIRYAKPPVGSLRFAPPVDEPESTAEIVATAYGPVSLQDIDPLPLALPGTEFNFYDTGVTASEDCLNLNVWTPDVDGSAPVFVWIHGGAFMYGSGQGPWASGERRAREDGVVVVSLNYRLGILGGLFLGDTDPQSSNLAIQDQISALRWVQRNIAAFGGDPNLVTIGGQSAGAMSTAALLCAPAARGLFTRAIVESGHLDATIGLDEARFSRDKVLAALHVDSHDPSLLERLRRLSTLRVLAVEREFGIAVRTFPLVTDDVVIDAAPIEALRSGCAREIDLLIGTTSEEDKLFEITGWAHEPLPVTQVIATILPDVEARAAALRLYKGVDEPNLSSLNHLIATEHAWSEPARWTALAHAASGGRTFHYEFAWGSSVQDGRVGAAHLVDLPFFWGNLDAPGTESLLGPEIHTDPRTIALSRNASAAVAAFIHTGDPSTPALGRWRQFSTTERATMVLNLESHLEHDHKRERLDFWESQRERSAKPLATIGVDE